MLDAKMTRKIGLLTNVMVLLLFILIIVFVGMYQRTIKETGYSVVNKYDLSTDDKNIIGYTLLINEYISETKLKKITEDIMLKTRDKYKLEALEIRFVTSYKEINKPFAKVIYAPEGDLSKVYSNDNVNLKNYRYNIIHY